MTTWEMADEELSFAEHVEAARAALSRGHRLAAAAAFHSAVGVARGDSALQRELVATLVQLGKLEQELGRPADAERLLTEALETGERQLGADHASLAPVLNELSRLYIRQSNHSRAEAALERLLWITRTKGEEHPDVATALAGLALVKRAVGDSAAAERRFREALRIREKALAPGHMATVVTMEQLSETCAARGNPAEALALLQRALPTREAALGSEHATVRALRARIAELEPRHPGPAATPVEEEAAPAPPAAPTQSHFPAPPSIARPARPRSRRLAAAGAIAIVLGTAGLTVGSRAGLGSDEPSASIATEDDTAAAAPATAGAAALGATTMALVVRPDSVRAANDDSTGVASAESPSLDGATPHAPPKLAIAPKRLAAVTSRLTVKTNVDSVVRASMTDGGPSLAAEIGTTVGSEKASHADDASGRPATIIGAAPVPRFPDELRSHWTEGEVVMRFRVDERGRVDASSATPLKTDHELFTAAVRSVLPRFRFEPARSPAPDSKPISSWVDYRVRFTAAK